MKKILSLLVLMIASVLSFAQARLEGLVKPGTKLIYAVEANEQKYDFIITIKALTPALVFDWQMSEPVNTSGTMTHTPTAMVSANAMYNYFISGPKTLDDNTLSVWISKNTLTSLTKGGRNAMMKMNINEPLRKMGTEEKEDESELNIIVNGEKETIEEVLAQELTAEGLPMTDGASFSFYNSAKMPVILRMKNGFSIVLKEIKTK
jgi:hypothetical protein